MVVGSSLLLPFDLGHLTQEVADLISVKFRNPCNAVDVLEQVFGSTQER